MTNFKGAKLAYLLCTCHEYSSQIFTKLIKKHEKSFAACSKYYFDLEIKMGFAPGPKKEFELKSVRNNFLNADTSDFYVHNILENINTLSAAEKKEIQSNYEALVGPSEKLYAEKNLYTVINLVRMYADKYNYLFIPCTLDYSQDVGLVHQCAIIVDLRKGMFLFYEPYGTYIKYERNYASTMKQYFEIYKKCLPARFVDAVDSAGVEVGTSTVRFSSFHGQFALEKGIQQIILDANNAAADSYRKDELMLFSEDFKQSFKDLYDRIQSRLKSDTNPVNKTDETINLLTIMEQFERYTISSTASSEKEKKEKYHQFWKQALKLYHDYNSKTCVSISLVELDMFFSGVDMLEFYKKYRDAVPKPNIPLMEDLYALLVELDAKAASVDELAQIRTICFR